MSYFAVYALDKPGMADTRRRVRPQHRARLRDHDHPLTVHVGGPLLDGSGEMCGTLLIVEAGTQTDVEAFVHGDPYALAGLYASVQIHPYLWGLGQPKEGTNG